MRILHTSDWHLGRSFHRVDLHATQARALSHLAQTVRRERVDLVVVAGDVYDRALPSVETVELLDQGLDEILATGAQVLMTSGNHDSAVRLGFGSRRSARAGLHVRARPDALADPVLLADAHGPVACYGIPYLEPGLVCEEFGVARSHEAVLGYAMDRIRQDLSTRDVGTRCVVAAHAFVVGGQGSDSERDIRVGGVDTAPAAVFDGADYVALGHLHGRQRITDRIRYSGSPLPYSFSEASHHKGAWLVDLGADGAVEVTAVDSVAHRPLKVLRDELDVLLTAERYTAAQDAYCQIVVTDAVRPRNAMERLQARFPHTVSLAFEPIGADTPPPAPAPGTTTSDADLCCSFLARVRGHEETEAERAVLDEALQTARAAEVAR